MLLRLLLTLFLTATLLRAADEPVLTNSIGMKLVRIAPGSFTMGQDGPLYDGRMVDHPTQVDQADWDEAPAHQVTLTQPYYLGATEVTLAQYRAFDPEFRLNDTNLDWALGGVSWDMAAAFCEWLAQKEGKPYRLPTEAEWEYACRAGSPKLFSTGDTLPAAYQPWFGDENLRTFYFKEAMPAEYRHLESKPVLKPAQGPANSWGLYDMHGNLSEWCLDWFGPYEAAAQTDPVGRVDGDFRVFRGGAHSEHSRLLRSANRRAWIPGSKSRNIGFRVALGDLPKITPLPVAAPAANAQNVSQSIPKRQPASPEIPYFSGPRVFVKVPPGSIGPLYAYHNHSPSITECPNGDLLATWYSCGEEPGTELNNLATRLRHGAEDWEEASLFWDGPDVNDHAPKLWWDGEQTLFHLVRGLSENIIRTSTDSGATWSKAALAFPHAELGNALIRTREGVLAITHDSRDVSLLLSRDAGKTWSTTGKRMATEARPGATGTRHPGIHAPIVQLTDGRLMAIGRYDRPEDQARFEGRTPAAYSADLGETWTYAATEFSAISSAQRPVLMRLKEGPLLICSFTDQARDWKNRKGMKFRAADGTEFTGYGLFAAVSDDDGKTWPHRRLVTPGGPAKELPTIDRGMTTFSDTLSERSGYLAATQTRDGRIQLISSKNHYVFNLAWLKER